MKNLKNVLSIILLLSVGNSALAAKNTKNKQTITTHASAHVTKLVNETATPVKVTIETEAKKYSYALPAKQTLTLDDDKFMAGLVKKFDIDGRDLTDEFKKQRQDIKKTEVQVTVTAKDAFKLR